MGAAAAAAAQASKGKLLLPAIYLNVANYGKTEKTVAIDVSIVYKPR